MKESTRIRYVKDSSSGWLVSKEMLAKEAIVIVTIEPDTMSFTLRTKDGKVLNKGAAKTLVAIKKMVKSSLKEIGVQFLDEVRNVKGSIISDLEVNENPKSEWGV